jgi:hypothetical protein
MNAVGGPRRTSFPGYRDDAPLDLPADLPDSALAGMAARLVDGTADAFSDALAAAGNCARPVRLVGQTTTIDTRTGEVVASFSLDHAPLGVLYRACGNRRADVCPACSRVYARDTFQMIRAGLVGGKTVPGSVADNPLLFATFTAQSFGHVHGARSYAGQPNGGRCRPRDRAKLCPHGRPVGCMKVHQADDPANGSPLCEDCYDWHSAVVWQWHAPELWRRTTMALKRHLARALGVSERNLGSVASVQYAKVAEYQARGAVHFHALIRLDGPDGPGSPAPIDGKQLARVVKTAARSVEFAVPPVDRDDVVRLVGWGRQLDVRIVRDRLGDEADVLRPEQVAGYLAKYATKDANPMRGQRGDPGPHLVRLSATCHQLAKRARLDDPAASRYLLLAKWAHMRGFRGHFSSKSRCYSVTLGRLRRARCRYQRLTAEAKRTGEALDLADLEARLMADDAQETTLVIGSWRYQGTGWTNPGDEHLALAAAARAREHDQWKAEQRRNYMSGGKGR